MASLDEIRAMSAEAPQEASAEQAEANQSEAVEAEQVEQTEAETQADEQAPERQVSVEETKARGYGWTDKDEWIAAGKDPNEWVNFNHFNKTGNLIDQINKVKRDTDKRLADQATFLKANFEMKLSDLMKERTEAIELADVTKVNALDKEIGKVSGEIGKINNDTAMAAQPDPADLQHENDWAQRNAWINGQSAKAIYAQTINQQAQATGLSGKQLTDYIEQAISKEFPATNPNRSKPSMTDKPAAKQVVKKQSVTMDSLTSQERQIYRAMKNSNPNLTEARFLQTVKDSRG